MSSWGAIDYCRVSFVGQWLNLKLNREVGRESYDKNDGIYELRSSLFCVIILDAISIVNWMFF